MKQAKMTVDREYAIGGVDRYLFGSFIEMYFNVVNGGIYDPNSPTADEMGFRRDVLDLVRELKVPIVRFPGGCTVSDYFWEDGVGPAESRIPRHNLVTGKTESNRFGTNEFFEWAKKAETDIFMVVNLATRTPRDAANHVEYCNHPGGSYYSDLRKSHGYANPHNIKIWGLDNEVDGPWSVGHKSADEYGRIAFLASSLMKRVDGSIKTVLCGSSGYGMPSFPQWDATVLEHCYDTADYISAHIYYDIKEGDSASYLASTMSMDRYIKDLAATCDYVKAKKRSKRKMHRPQNRQ